MEDFATPSSKKRSKWEHELRADAMLQSVFEQGGTPSSRDAKSTRIIVRQCPPTSSDGKSTRFVNLTRSILTTWRQFDKSILFETVHPHYMMPTSPQEVHKKFLSDMVLPHHVMPSPQEFLFDTVHHHQEWCQVDKNSSFVKATLITWCQVHKNFSSDIAHPHHVMHVPQEFIVEQGTPSSSDTSPQDLFVPKGQSSSK